MSNRVPLKLSLVSKEPAVTCDAGNEPVTHLILLLLVEPFIFPHASSVDASC